MLTNLYFITIRITCIPQGSGCILNHSTRERQDSHSVPDKEGRQTTTILRSVQVSVADPKRKTSQSFLLPFAIVVSLKILQCVQCECNSLTEILCASHKITESQTFKVILKQKSMIIQILGMNQSHHIKFGYRPECDQTTINTDVTVTITHSKPPTQLSWTGASLTKIMQ